MLTLTISAIVGLSLGLGLYISDAAHGGWCIFWGLLGFGASQAGKAPA